MAFPMAEAENLRMVFSVTVTCLFAVVSIAVALSLVDSWMRGMNAFGSLMRERALLNQAHVVQRRGLKQAPVASNLPAATFASRAPRRVRAPARTRALAMPRQVRFADAA